MDTYVQVDRPERKQYTYVQYLETNPERLDEKAKAKAVKSRMAEQRFDALLVCS